MSWRLEVVENMNGEEFSFGQQQSKNKLTRDVVDNHSHGGVSNVGGYK
jgi:hypothetical protein